MSTCPVITSIQLLDMLNTANQLPAAVSKIQQVLYTTNKGPVLAQAVFPSSYTPAQIDAEYVNFVSTRLIQAMKETEFWALYALVTQDQIKFDINTYNYFYKKLTYDIIAIYDSLVKYHANDLRTLVLELNKYTDPIHTKVLLENVFNPVNKVWGFSAIATLYCMYVRTLEGTR